MIGAMCFTLFKMRKERNALTLDEGQELSGTKIGAMSGDIDIT